jgi:Peptidase family C25/FlgD Ig-like domain
MIFTKKYNFFTFFLSQTLFLAAWFANVDLFAQNFNINVQLDWEIQPRIIPQVENQTNVNYPFFANAAFDEQNPTLPVFIHKIALSQPSEIEAVLQNQLFEPLGYNLLFAELLATDIQPVATLSFNKKRPQAHIKFVPLRLNPQTNQIEKLVSANLLVRTQPSNLPNRPAVRNVLVSKLNDGEIYKIGVQNSGIYKIDYNFLKNMGVDVDNINPQNIQILGNTGAMLPELNAETRTDDLAENAVFVQGENDGRFDAQDFILFYAQGTTTWKYDSATAFFKHKLNLYSDQNFYFIKIANNNGKRIQNQTNITSTAYNTNSYDALAFTENELLNLLNKEQPALPPTGRDWFGDAFQTRRTQVFNFQFANRQTNEPVKISSRVVSRAQSASRFDFSANGQAILSSNTTAANFYVYSSYATQAISNQSFTVGGSDVSLQITYNNSSSSSEAWLDYLCLNARANLQYSNGLVFRDQRTMSHNSSTFQLNGANASVNIWDITNLSSINKQEVVFGSNLTFGVSTNNILKEFIAFEGNNFPNPTALGRIANQNLHAMSNPPTFLIVYHPNFAGAAQRLAAHRNNITGMLTQAVDIFQIYNEFSSGKEDLTAIRDFAKMLYNRSQGGDTLRYLLLLGNGSFDYKNISLPESANSDFVPSFQTIESLNPLGAYTTDDFFALLDDNEGNVNADQDLDIAIGRLPVVTAAEADVIVDKIINYEISPDMFGDWRNQIAFIADDEDGNLHFSDAEAASRLAASRDSLLNIDKIYLDAYVQQSTGGGNRYPNVNEAILRRIFKGALIVNYIGHGADDGVTQERVFTNVEINSLTNDKKLPLFITATCSFSPFEDPNIVSAGELLLLNPQGGAIGLLTTVRVVLADANATLTNNTFNVIFQRQANGKMPTIGEVLRNAKNTSGLLSASNSRKYVLLGDPSLTLAYPKYNIATTQINGRNIQVGNDTLQALQRVTISGEVQDFNNNLASNFNGLVYPTVYDKIDTLLTRANDVGSRVAAFPLQKKIIFNGQATVLNGRFTFSFVVPRDINYTVGLGRISYYADDNQNIDANGMYRGFLIGGTSPNAATDNTPPQVRVFMNDENFAFGGLTDANPVLLAKLYDDNGINTVGNGIGHDLTLSLYKNEVKNTNTNATENYVLNDFYQSETDDYRRGTVRFPLGNLKDGHYTANVEAWDVFNNVGRGNTEFIVSNAADVALQHVLNYPNPFTTSTNFQFEHNMPDQTLDVQIQVFSISGSLIKTIQQTCTSEGYRISNIHWDGLDDYGDKLARGTYIYKISVKTENNNVQQASEYQKLVILR